MKDGVVRSEMPMGLVVLYWRRGRMAFEEG
jgi:hypothetical protein